MHDVLPRRRLRRLIDRTVVGPRLDGVRANARSSDPRMNRRSDFLARIARSTKELLHRSEQRRGISGPQGVGQLQRGSILLSVPMKRFSHSETESPNSIGVRATLLRLVECRTTVLTIAFYLLIPPRGLREEAGVRLCLRGKTNCGAGGTHGHDDTTYASSGFPSWARSGRVRNVGFTKMTFSTRFEKAPFGANSARKIRRVDGCHDGALVSPAVRMYLTASAEPSSSSSFSSIPNNGPPQRQQSTKLISRGKGRDDEPEPAR